MIYGNIKFPKADLQRMDAAIRKAVDETGQDLKSAGQWAGRLVCESLAASTVIAPKLRRIVSNPAFKGKGAKRSRADMRRARFGVMAPAGRDRVMTFKPIYRTGEFGKIRFISKTTAEWLVRDRATGEVHRESRLTGGGEEDMAGIAQSKKRIIRRRGLAKLVWKSAQTRMMTGGTLNGAGVSRIGRVVVRGSKTNPTLRIENNLQYALDAFKTDGEQAVESTLRRASDKMMNRVADKVDKALRGI